MKLQRIELENFNSINRAIIEELSDINVFFGPTNSGKTSLLASMFFQFHHQQIPDPKRYYEFLHSQANPRDSFLRVSSRWCIEEVVPALDLHPKDVVDCVTHIRFSGNDLELDDRVDINGKQEENIDREDAIFRYFRDAVKFSSSRRPGDTKRTYFSDEETNDQRRQRFLRSLQDLRIQGNRYQEFLSHLQKLFPHLIYSNDTEKDILEFFGSGFLSTAKLFVYLYDARYQLVLIDEPEIHFYPSLVRRFVRVLHEIVETLNKQIIIATHSTLFVQERDLGTFYHISKSKHFRTDVRKVDQNNLLGGLDMLNAPPEAILQSDIILYTEGPTDIGVMQEFIRKFTELAHINISVFHLGGGAMGNLNVDPLELKKHNPLSCIIIDSERTTHGGAPDPAHSAFLERCHAAHVYCLMLERQAMENYFSARALRSVFGKKIPDNFTMKPYKPLTHQGMAWYDKSRNRDVARAMTRKEIEEHPDLRLFFQELIALSKQLQ